MNDKLLQQIRTAQKRADDASRASAIAADRVGVAQAALDRAVAEAEKSLGKKLDAAGVLKALDQEITKVEAKAEDLCVEATEATAELNTILSAAGDPDGE